MTDSALDTPTMENQVFVPCNECRNAPSTSASSCCPRQIAEMTTGRLGCWQKKRVPFSGTTFVDVREDEVRG